MKRARQRESEIRKIQNGKKRKERRKQNKTKKKQ